MAAMKAVATMAALFVGLGAGIYAGLIVWETLIRQIQRKRRRKHSGLSLQGQQEEEEEEVGHPCKQGWVTCNLDWMEQNIIKYSGVYHDHPCPRENQIRDCCLVWRYSRCLPLHWVHVCAELLMIVRSSLNWPPEGVQEMRIKSVQFPRTNWYCTMGPCVSNCTCLGNELVLPWPNELGSQ